MARRSPTPVAVAYVDSSAIVKLIVREPESAHLRRFLRRYPTHVSSALSRTEVLRAVRRADPRAIPRAQQALAKLGIVDLSDALLAAAGLLDHTSLRTLDAIHLVTARALAPQLGALVTYDQRMAAAALDLGLPVHSPV